VYAERVREEMGEQLELEVGEVEWLSVDVDEAVLGLEVEVECGGICDVCGGHQSVLLFSGRFTRE
jgi:hypothetical protein